MRPSASSIDPATIRALSTRPGRAIIKAAVCHFLHRTRKGPGTTPEDIAAKIYGKDDAGTILTRAAVSPAMTTTSGWASQLVATSVSDFIGSLSGVSAAVRLLQLGLVSDFGA